MNRKDYYKRYEKIQKPKRIKSYSLREFRQFKGEAVTYAFRKKKNYPFIIIDLDLCDIVPHFAN